MNTVNAIRNTMIESILMDSILDSAEVYWPSPDPDTIRVGRPSVVNDFDVLMMLEPSRRKGGSQAIWANWIVATALKTVASEPGDLFAQSSIVHNAAKEIVIGRFKLEHVSRVQDGVDLLFATLRAYREDFLRAARVHGFSPETVDFTYRQVYSQLRDGVDLDSMTVPVFAIARLLEVAEAQQEIVDGWLRPIDEMAYIPSIIRANPVVHAIFNGRVDNPAIRLSVSVWERGTSHESIVKSCMPPCPTVCLSEGDTCVIATRGGLFRALLIGPSDREGIASIYVEAASREGIEWFLGLPSIAPFVDRPLPDLDEEGRKALLSEKVSDDNPFIRIAARVEMGSG